MIGIQDFWVYILYECAKGTKGWIDLVNDSYNSNLLRKSPCLINIGLTDYPSFDAEEACLYLIELVLNIREFLI